MSALSFNFSVLKYCGLWRPREWPVSWRTRLYTAYTSLIVFLVFSMTFTEMIDLVQHFSDAEDFTSSAFIMLTMVCICGKIITVLGSRERIIGLLDTLKSDYFSVHSDLDKEIREYFDQLIKFRTNVYARITEVGMVAIVGGSFVTELPQGILPYHAWYPINLTTKTQITVAFVQQHGIHSIGAIINIAYDTLIPGIMLEICAQLGLLRNRFELVTKIVETMRFDKEKLNNEEVLFIESQNISHCIRHHLLIYEFVAEVNKVFGPLILMQYASSSIVLCACVFRLAGMDLSDPLFVSFSMYIAAMGSQIFILCYAGTDVTEECYKFTDGIYKTNWHNLSTSGQKSMLLIMKRNIKPVIFSCISLIEISIDSFIKLIKLSYSAFNFLQQSS